MSIAPPMLNPNDIESYIYQEIDALGNTLASGSGGGGASVVPINYALSGSTFVVHTASASPADGTRAVYYLNYISGNTTVTLGTGFVIPASATSPLPFSTGSGVTDILGAIYHASSSNWYVASFVPGYTG